MQRDQLPRYRHAATYVLPRWKLVYVSNPKAACTSIKWLLADLQGADPEAFYSTLRYETSRDATIHRERDRWPGTPRLKNLSEEQLADITPDNGWLVFTATRHPASRLWSGWQSKLLLREPSYEGRFGEEPWFPRVPRSSDDVVSEWLRFVEHVRADPTIRILQDVHFRSQVQQLSVGTMPYDRLYDTSEFRTLLDDLTKHLRELGWDGELRVRRSNETPLAALTAAYPTQVLETIEDVYRNDYEGLGYDRGMPPKTREDAAYSDDLIASVGILIERHQRIGDLARNARAIQRRLRRLREEQAAGSAPDKPASAKPGQQGRSGQGRSGQGKPGQGKSGQQGKRGDDAAARRSLAQRVRRRGGQD
jgi:hypothetical protein